MLLNINDYVSRLFCLLLLCSLNLGCKKDFLEITPKGVLLAKTTYDYEMLLKNKQKINTIGGLSYVPMSDEVAGYTPYFVEGMLGGLAPFDTRSFKWEADLYLPTDAAGDYKMLSLTTYIYNKVINEVLDSEEGSQQQKQQLRAEALANRAWTYFMLTNLYGKPYHPSTAATDLSVPLITKADVSQTQFKRATVQEVYNQIITDLNEAIAYLPAEVKDRARISGPAAVALLGKVYVHMGKYKEALPLLSETITNLNKALIPLGLYDFKKETESGGIFTTVDLYGRIRFQTEQDREVLYLKTMNNHYVLIGSGLVISPEAMALFKPGDLRLKFMSNSPLMQTDPYPNGMHRVWGRAQLFFGNIQSACNIGVNVPDIYLLLAECKARLGDTAGSLTDLLTLRRNRMPEQEALIPTALSTDKMALTRFILDERIREYAMTGERWFDMRRLSVDPDFKATVGTTHKIYDKIGQVTETYTLTPERLTLRFPTYIISANPGMPQNP